MTLKAKSVPKKNGLTIPGTEASSRLDPWWWLVAAVIALVLFLIVGTPDPYQRIVRFVSDGITVTISITFVSFFITLVVGLLGGLGRISKNRYVNGATSLYVEVVRGIPLMVQLMWWYFAFPEVIQGVGRSMEIEALATYRANPYAMAVIGLVICYGAYMSEIYRAGIQSIPKGQMEAARSMGMSYIQGMRYVIIPQAVRVILPPVGNEFVALLKDSSLVSVVAVSDLTRRGREFSAMTYDPVPTWIMVALLYLVLTLLAARVVTIIEKKTTFER
jgi:polar amino acid transport system permease protein